MLHITLSVWYWDGVLCPSWLTICSGWWLPITRPYIIHSNLVNFNVKYLKNRRIGYPTCIPFLKISPRWVDLNNKNDMLRIMQERTQHETKPTIFVYFFHEFLHSDVYIPHPPVTMNSLRKQIYFLPKWYIMLCFFYKKVIIT